MEEKKVSTGKGNLFPYKILLYGVLKEQMRKRRTERQTLFLFYKPCSLRDVGVST